MRIPNLSSCQGPNKKELTPPACKNEKAWPSERAAFCTAASQCTKLFADSTQTFKAPRLCSIQGLKFFCQVSLFYPEGPRLSQLSSSLQHTAEYSSKLDVPKALVVLSLHLAFEGQVIKLLGASDHFLSQVLHLWPL